MSSFTEPLLVTIDNDKKKPFVLQKNFIYCVGELNSGNEIIVEKGFRTDFASIPKLFRIFFDRIGTHSKAALVHDKLYDVKITSRKQADRIFFEAMEVYKVNSFKKWAFYLAVRGFGWFPWYKKKWLEDQEELRKYIKIRIFGDEINNNIHNGDIIINSRTSYKKGTNKNV
jgi:hypothetical protein